MFRIFDLQLRKFLGLSLTLGLCLVTYFHVVPDTKTSNSNSLDPSNSADISFEEDPNFTPTEARKMQTFTQLEETRTPTPTSKGFSVNQRGYWDGLGATKFHMFDPRLARELVNFFVRVGANTILELGAGEGLYSQVLQSKGFFVSCYDGNPMTQALSNGHCGVIDLTLPTKFTPHDWVLSLEVGEHIPKEFEPTYINNLHEGNVKGIVLSWAIEGQGGTAHVNTHNNSYIRNVLKGLNYFEDFREEFHLRKAAKFSWFKNTIMVFRKQ